MNRRNGSTAVYLSLLSFLALALPACNPEEGKSSKSTPLASAEELQFRNLDPKTKYVGDKECAPCHEEIFKSFKQTGMGRSLYTPSSLNRVEDVTHNNHVYDPRSNFHYEVVSKGNELYQTEYRIGEHGQRTHELTRKVAYIIGSGNHARTYLTEENGFLYEMPLTWFSKQKGWAMSPGFEYSNFRFSRPINANCMNCHSSFAECIPYSGNRFSGVPQGIGCERCHGPGELHVAKRYKPGRAASMRKGIDSTIVNPLRLPPTLQMDVCFQCHLQGMASVFKSGRQKTDFRPGMRLRDVLSIYVPDSLSPGDVRVASHGERFSQSACYVKSNGAFVCITCHDPHKPVKFVLRSDFNNVCVRCHRPESLSRSSAQAQHDPNADCIRCHMPQRKTWDVTHANFTDHWIQKEPSAKSAVRPNSSTGLKDFFAETDPMAQLRLALANLQYYDASSQTQVEFERAVSVMEKNLHSDPHNEEALYRLGLAYGRLQRLDEAEEKFRSLIAVAPRNALAYLQLAMVLDQMGRQEEALGSYQTALRLFPESAVGLTQIGALYLRLNNPTSAVESFRKAIDVQPGYAPAHNALGEYLMYQRHEPAAAKPLFLEALRLEPDHIPILNDLGLVEHELTNNVQAEKYFRRVLAQNPRYVPALGNLALLCSLQGRTAEERVFLARALQIDPQNTRLKAMLSRLEKLKQAGRK